MSAQAATPVVQREVTIEHIDYNPETREFRDGYIDQGPVYAAIGDWIAGNRNFQERRQGGGVQNSHANRWNTVRGIVSELDFTAPDVHRVATAIAAAVAREYRNLDLTFPDTARDDVAILIRPVLGANVRRDYQVSMTQEEATAFDRVATTVAPGRMSRQKEVASPVDHAALPGDVRGAVDLVLGDIRAERARWTVAALDETLVLANGEFQRQVVARQRGLHYQGNHTNNSGWLRAAAAPPDLVATAAQAIYDGASAGLKKRLLRPNALALLDYPSAGGQLRPNAHRAEFEQLKLGALGALTDAGVKSSALSVLCGGLGGYIEFNMPSEISRLMYDAEHGDVYITAHYKWREGYNPFFQVNSFPAV